MSAISTLSGPLVWGADLAKTPEKFTLSLDTQACDEVKAALAEFKANELGFEAIRKETFPLPKLKDLLTNASEELHNGKGFVILTGLDVGSLSAEDSTIVYLGIASHIADKQGVQNKDGEVMTHITDNKKWTVAPEKRHGIHSQKSLGFHSDMGADILSLHARASAKTGGTTYLASASVIYNDLAKNHPKKLVALRTDDWPIQVSGDNKYFTAPLMQLHDGKLLTSVDPARLGPHPNSVVAKGEKGVPELTPTQESALEAFTRSARKNEVPVRLQKDDMLFLNNWAIVHRRDAYKDSEGTSRHLVRLWLRNTKLGWEIPSTVATPWKRAFGSAHEKVYNSEPPKVYSTPAWSAGSAGFVVEDNIEPEAESKESKAEPRVEPKDKPNFQAS